MGIKLLGWLVIAHSLAGEVIRRRYHLAALLAPSVGRVRENDRLDVALGVLSSRGDELLVLTYLLTPWLDALDYHLPKQFAWLGALLLAASLMLLWRAHVHLGSNWRPGGSSDAAQLLVTDGVYAYVRHPIYAALGLSRLAQPLLVRNWFAGWMGLVLFVAFYLYRVPREERALAGHFGPAYLRYASRTGSLWPAPARGDQIPSPD